jgi:hypothetical protein
MRKSPTGRELIFFQGLIIWEEFRRRRLEARKILFIPYPGTRTLTTLNEPGLNGGKIRPASPVNKLFLQGENGYG